MNLKERIGNTIFRDEPPALLPNGSLAPYTTDLARITADANSIIGDFRDDPQQLITHTTTKLAQNTLYLDIINELHAKIYDLYCRDPLDAISGTRDTWLYSVPIAAQLNLPHLAVFNDGRVIRHNGDTTDAIDGLCTIHVTTELRDGREAYTPAHGEKGFEKPESGPLHALRERGALVKNLVAIIDHNQGGTAHLSSTGVNAHALLTIDVPFLANYSRQPEKAIQYFADPNAWVKDLFAHGTIEPVIAAFTKADERTQTLFWRKHGGLAANTGHYLKFKP